MPHRPPRVSSQAVTADHASSRESKSSAPKFINSLHKQTQSSLGLMSQLVSVAWTQHRWHLHLLGFQATWCCQHLPGELFVPQRAPWISVFQHMSEASVLFLMQGWLFPSSFNSLTPWFLMLQGSSCQQKGEGWTALIFPTGRNLHKGQGLLEIPPHSRRQGWENQNPQRRLSWPQLLTLLPWCLPGRSHGMWSPPPHGLKEREGMGLPWTEQHREPQVWLEVAAWEQSKTQTAAAQRRGERRENGNCLHGCSTA